MQPLEELATLRQTGQRKSARVCDLGEAILESKGGIGQLKGEERWPFLEQLAVAALDVGKLDLARVCIDRLNSKFPDSPRVKPLMGMLLEAGGNVDMARLFYEQELAEDENNTAIRKRLITMHLHTRGNSLSQAKGVELLVDHLNTTYTDPEAWLELVEVYTQLNLLPQALSALGDLILLQPQNPAYLLRYAKTALDLNDLDLAYRYYLRTIELLGKDGVRRSVIARQAAISVKQLIPKLRGKGLPGSSAPSPLSASATPSPQRLDDIDIVLTEQLAEVYGTQGVPSSGGSPSDDTNAKLLENWSKQLEAELAQSI